MFAIRNKNQQGQEPLVASFLGATFVFGSTISGSRGSIGTGGAFFGVRRGGGGGARSSPTSAFGITCFYVRFLLLLVRHLLLEAMHLLLVASCFY